MDKIGSKLEQKPQPRNVSQEFLSMDPHDFRKFLWTLRNEKELYIEIDWQDVRTARRLKAFVESDAPEGQLRNAAIKATKEQHDQEHNVFGSGVGWIEVKS